MTRGHTRDGTIVDQVRRYAAAMREAALDQANGDMVCSPLGIWLLLCACLPASSGAQQERLEAIVGCSAPEAIPLLDGFLADVPPAIRAVIAFWLRAPVETDALHSWLAQLPTAIKRGPMPSQAEANAWANRETLGLIPTYPAELQKLDFVLASVLATKVSWAIPYNVGRAADRFPVTSPWRDAVEHVLWTSAIDDTAIVQSSAAGLVAVHEARSKDADGLVVMCVSADPAVDRASVLAAAYEIGQHVADTSRIPVISLFDLPQGDGHSWSIVEREVPTHEPWQRYERIDEVTLPAWSVRSETDLLKSPAFGATLACEVLAGLMPVVSLGAKQVALASFDPFGFEAAAITHFGTLTGIPSTPPAIGLERVANLRFDHPFAVVARADGELPANSERFRGLPAFEAWIATPGEVPVQQAGD